jgi:hypothetical protein
MNNQSRLRTTSFRNLLLNNVSNKFCIVVFWQFCAMKACIKSFMARFRQFTKRQLWQRFLVQKVLYILHDRR